ncbi:MAG: selenocysteine-specific translation elongation factor [Acidimicrobiia bacterium]|nr:selenocysteine-specific translation elongation factor [Acidimicrobiia bacterium]
MHVVATAGHVDHGKSTLVRTLTGTDPDRWPEEKERGLTIDLGFAHLELPSGRELAFVDVPGHVRFIRNMLAGVGAVDACLFVVAATEGWKPQSEEHLRILELLGLRHGVVALTKVALCDADLRGLARLDLAEHLVATFLEGAEVVEVDAPTGLGVTDLVDALDRLTLGTPTAADRARPRLWVDRRFAAKGSGTVVTGTLAGGSLAVDDELVLLPQGARARVRGLQAHHQHHQRLGPGHRVAVNLTGIGHGEIGRGDVLVRDGQWATTDTVDAELSVLTSLDHDVSRRGAYVAYLGSGELPVKLRVLGGRPLAPGDRGAVRLHLPWAVPLLPGDRYVLRESGRQETVGGGEVLDVAPVRSAATASPDRSVDRVVRERGWVEADLLERLTGERRAPTLGRWVVDAAVLDSLLASLAVRVGEAGPLGLDVARLDERERAALGRVEGVTTDAGRARLGPGPVALDDHPYLAALDAAPFAPPPPDGVPRDELRELVRRGLVVAEDGAYFSAAAVEAAALLLAELLARAPEGLTIGELRDALGNTRRHVLPLVAVLDKRGVTRRRGDRRVAGPRLPQAGAASRTTAAAAPATDPSGASGDRGGRRSDGEAS